MNNKLSAFKEFQASIGDSYNFKVYEYISDIPFWTRMKLIFLKAVQDHRCVYFNISHVDHLKDLFPEHHYILWPDGSCIYIPSCYSSCVAYASILPIQQKRVFKHFKNLNFTHSELLDEWMR